MHHHCMNFLNCWTSTFQNFFMMYSLSLSLSLNKYIHCRKIKFQWHNREALLDLLFGVKSGLRFVFRCRRRCCMWWQGWRSTPPGTTVYGRAPTYCWWTGYRYCWCIHHSYSCQRHCLHYLRPTQRCYPSRLDPTESHHKHSSQQ